jgi:monofunctional glycosyltransferase
MAENIILTLIIEFLSLPFVCLSRIAEILDLWNLGIDIELCLKVIDSSTSIIPEKFVSALIAAEDRRNALHLGVDPIAILRALLVKVTRNQTQGASTIEQQFVRSASGRCERTFRRKLREQALALAVGRLRSKRQIACAYLSIAFYGSGCTGIEGLRKCCGHQLKLARSSSSIAMIAMLKYPQPLNPSPRWQHKIQNRIQYIEQRMPQAEIGFSQLSHQLLSVFGVSVDSLEPSETRLIKLTAKMPL